MSTHIKFNYGKRAANGLVYRENRPNGYEVWYNYDPSAGVYELFASSQFDDYIG